jgi:hypothetical protein
MLRCYKMTSNLPLTSRFRSLQPWFENGPWASIIFLKPLQIRVTATRKWHRFIASIEPPQVIPPGPHHCGIPTCFASFNASCEAKDGVTPVTPCVSAACGADFVVPIWGPCCICTRSTMCVSFHGNNSICGESPRCFSKDSWRVEGYSRFVMDLMA